MSKKCRIQFSPTETKQATTVQHNKKLVFEEKLKKESDLVKMNSLSVLKEFEQIDNFEDKA
jgi:hypothetical protein